MKQGVQPRARTTRGFPSTPCISLDAGISHDRPKYNHYSFGFEQHWLVVNYHHRGFLQLRIEYLFLGSLRSRKFQAEAGMRRQLIRF